MRFGCRRAVRWDNMIVEGIFYKKGLVRAPIQTTKVRVVLREHHLRLYNVDLLVDFEVIDRSDRGRRREAV